MVGNFSTSFEENLYKDLYEKLKRDFEEKLEQEKERSDGAVDKKKGSVHMQTVKNNCSVSAKLPVFRPSGRVQRSCVDRDFLSEERIVQSI